MTSTNITATTICKPMKGQQLLSVSHSEVKRHAAVKLAHLGGIVLRLQHNRAARLAICKARYIGHGCHVSNEVRLVLAGGNKSVVHILLVKQQPLWHLPHTCSKDNVIDDTSGKQKLMQKPKFVLAGSHPHR